ncbi:MAG: phenylalanine--tRNA ligase subunit beta [Chloroflexi bacterium RBG_16_69_14]|nr:MAG: phenylalanine--tRNA ligase subunit beta [Chloroflexi bacterium RBG_16_69_14]
MRVPLSWLREIVDIELSPDALAERLTLLGMEVKAIVRWGDDWRNVVVGELLSVERHPRADRLSLTRVTMGDGEPLEIVCGATNIAAGQRVPVALPGAILPGDRRIERTEKMGVVSHGMLCSGDELGLTADADGILILPADSPLGRPLVDLFGDTVLDVDVKPNRGDALSIVGLAREVAAVTGGTVRLPPTDVTEAGRPTAERLRVEVLDPDLCPRFVGRWVSGVRVGPSPDWVQMRLLAAGHRPVSNVVDASNYVMVELGKPIHTFDAAAVHDGRIIVRRAIDGERLETLDHVGRELDHDTLVIADPAGPIGIAGVMGSAASEVSERTTEVVVESAIFDPISIRRTAFRYALRSDASLRFEKGQESRLARVGADRTARLIAEWAGGEVAPGAIDSNPADPAPAHVAFRPSRVNRLLGTTFETAEQRDLLARVGIETQPARPGRQIRIAAGTQPLDIDAGDSEVLDAIVPSWRRDLSVEADIAEEVIRVRGYELVPASLPHTPMPTYRHDPLALRDTVRETLVGAGLSEVVTFALVAPRLVERFPAHDDGALDGEPEQRAAGRPLVVTNPLSSQHSVLRQTLVGSLLEVVSTNLRVGRDDIAIFEVGKGYGATDDPPTREWWRLGIALTGAALQPGWDRPARAYDLNDAKGVLELLCRRLGFPAPAYTPITDDPNLHPGRAARVTAGGSLVGRVGELHPEVIATLDLRVERVYVAEVAVAGLAGGEPADPRVTAPSRHLSVERDIAVIVPGDRPAADVEAVIRRHGGPLLRAVALFDIYRGKPLADTEVSLAYRLTLRDDARTLTEEELDAAVATIVAGLTAEVGARFRT